MTSVNLLRGPGDSLISATGRAGAGSPRRSAKAPTAPAAARMPAARTIARLLPREWGAVVWEDEATGAADRSKADPGVARRPDGLAPAGGGASVDRSRSDLRRDDGSAPSAFGLLFDGIVDGMHLLPRRSSVDANVFSAALSSRPLWSRPFA